MMKKFKIFRALACIGAMLTISTGVLSVFAESEIIDETRVPVEDFTVNINNEALCVGQTAQFSAAKSPSNATDMLKVRYESSDESILTVDNNGVVTALGEGEATVTAFADSLYISETNPAADCYTVLILDISTSMDANNAIQVQHDAAVNFCKTLLNDDSGLKYHIAIITLGSESVKKADFTDNLSVLEAAIPSAATEGTNYVSALEMADSILSPIDEKYTRNIVLCSDGIPEHGASSTIGPYTSDDLLFDYVYANAAYNTAQSLKEKYHLYTLGFFHGISDADLLAFAEKVMADIAEEPRNFTLVTDPDKLDVAFTDISGRFITAAATGHFEKSMQIKVHPEGYVPPLATNTISLVAFPPLLNIIILMIAALAALCLIALILFLLSRRQSQSEF